ncbi:DgyrCDS3716 [Dimorphilus gyrociliatus]|uniref:Dolichyl-diphosphooligosaccharide--protein glycosyltransferase subunit 2 n=1 Tax=Dimorphilus gyrociliatus TaxID=2664684 RepID=A0A7I8VER2_9ANNE|nr:DgyrCDS3716 [Dimorphilus gyrociliatus]
MPHQGLLILLLNVVLLNALTPSLYFTKTDKERLKGVYLNAKPYADLASCYYSVLGLNLLGERHENPTETCNFLKSKLDSKDLESLFFASSAAKILGSCQISKGDTETTLNKAISADSPVLKIYQAISSLSNFGFKIDSNKASEALHGALKKDDSALSHGYAFYAASFLTTDLKKFYDLIEDIIAQADEVEDVHLQFEGGLHTTALVIDASFQLAASAKKEPIISQEKLIKFANYFLSRKHVQQLRNAAAVLRVVKTLTNNNYHIPVAVSLASQVAISDSLPLVKVKVSNLLGESLGKLNVVADSAKHKTDGAVVISKSPFKVSPADDSIYELDLIKSKPPMGFYSISVTAASQKDDKRLIGLTGAAVEVKVTTKVQVTNVEIGVLDNDQTTAGKTTKLVYPNKAASILEADTHQRLIMTFSLKDKNSGKALNAHQTFVRLSNIKTKEELTYVAESDKASSYKFDLDVKANAKDFGYKSGKYTVDLIIGDAVIQNPISWTVAEVQLSLGDAPPAKASSTIQYKKKPEIKHLFREPEKRPPVIVSTAFTFLCLAPLGVLLVAWMILGINVSNMPFSISALGFHIGLGGIFVLYYWYWVSLSMFTTLRYLAVLGLPTFLFGNRLLASIAAKRKEK